MIPFNWNNFSETHSWHHELNSLFTHFRLEGIEKAERNVLPLLSLANLRWFCFKGLGKRKPHSGIPGTTCWRIVRCHWKIGSLVSGEWLWMCFAYLRVFFLTDFLEAFSLISRSSGWASAAVGPGTAGGAGTCPQRFLGYSVGVARSRCLMEGWCRLCGNTYTQHVNSAFS